MLLMRVLTALSVTVAAVYGQGAGINQGDGPNQIVVDSNEGKRSVALRTHSLQPPYLDSDLQSRWFPSFTASANARWEFGGDTVIDTNRQFPYLTRLRGVDKFD